MIFVWDELAAVDEAASDVREPDVCEAQIPLPEWLDVLCRMLLSDPVFFKSGFGGESFWSNCNLESEEIPCEFFVFIDSCRVYG